MYANYENTEFDSTKLYAFTRSTENELLFIITNFSDQDIEATTVLPEEMFNFLKLDPRKVKEAKELFSNKKIAPEELFSNRLNTKVKAHSGKIIKFSLR